MTDETQWKNREDATTAGAIYCIVNSFNGKAYIGSTAVTALKRVSRHIYDLRAGRHHNTHLQSAWNKYGKGAFEFNVLEFGIDNSRELIIREQFWLDYYKEFSETYNQTGPVQNPRLGVKASAETLQKMKIARLGTKASPETIAKITGKKASLETRKKMSDVRKGIALSPKFTEAMMDKNSREYPSLINKKMNIIVPPGKNLSAVCRIYNISSSAHMWEVIRGERGSYCGWELNRCE